MRASAQAKPSFRELLELLEQAGRDALDCGRADVAPQVFLEAVAAAAVVATVEVRLGEGHLAVGELPVEVALEELLALLARVERHDGRLLGQQLLQPAAAAVQPRHHRADRDVEDLRGLRVAELADVDEDDRVAVLVGQLGERVHDAILRQTLDDALLVEHLLARDLRKPVGEVVVAFLQRLEVR